MAPADFAQAAAHSEVSPADFAQAVVTSIVTDDLCELATPSLRTPASDVVAPAVSAPVAMAVVPSADFAQAAELNCAAGQLA